MAKFEEWAASYPLEKRSYNQMVEAAWHARDTEIAKGKELARIILYQHSVAGIGHSSKVECETCKIARAVAEEQS